MDRQTLTTPTQTDTNDHKVWWVLQQQDGEPETRSLLVLPTQRMHTTLVLRIYDFNNNHLSDSAGLVAVV